ncbi:hypothetical protein WA026_005821 [Henosepilachna vigintioctopunctata]|uniref:BRISC and BRCA1-A complex member 1 n=1 Tax=Henosepilachna vigintioctopunctata TaxID=420089 RepID=A0AAW1U532_9CUCU
MNNKLASNVEENEQLSPPTSESDFMSDSPNLSQEKTGGGRCSKDTNIPLISNISEEFSSLNCNDFRVSCNVKEKIIIVLDRCKDEEHTPFQDNHGNIHNFLSVLKNAIEMFVHLKSSIDEKHQFALVLLDENEATWCLDFTNNVKEIVKSLNTVHEGNAEDVFNLNSLFDEISKRVNIPDVLEGFAIPPPFTVRVILFYNRSFTYPDIEITESVKELLQNSCFNVDVLVSHEPLDSVNNCEKIFKILQNIDKKGYSYFFSVGRDISTLMRSMGKLLGHPLQRPVQNIASYSFS